MTRQRPVVFVHAGISAAYCSEVTRLIDSRWPMTRWTVAPNEELGILVDPIGTALVSRSVRNRASRRLLAVGRSHSGTLRRPTILLSDIHPPERLHSLRVTAIALSRSMLASAMPMAATYRVSGNHCPMDSMPGYAQWPCSRCPNRRRGICGLCACAVAELHSENQALLERAG